MRGARAGLAIGAFLAVLGVSSTAAATPLAIRHGRSIRVALAGRTEPATALRPIANCGWKLELANATAGAVLSFRDVTGGMTAAPRFELPVVAGGVVLDSTRFRADHAYRVELRQGQAVVGTVLIYLQPPRGGRGSVVFDDRDALGSTRDDELAPSDKGAL
jgi:hypothetical protein